MEIFFTFIIFINCIQFYFFHRYIILGQGGWGLSYFVLKQLYSHALPLDYFRVTISALNICYILDHQRYGCLDIPRDFYGANDCRETNFTKRPIFTQSQIHALERKMEDVLAKYTDLSVRYADLSTKSNDQSAKYNDLSAKYNTLLTKTNGL